MSRDERRRSERQPRNLAVSIAVTEPIELEGQTVNLSTRGVLLRAQGQLPVLVRVRGKDYQGFLVRAFRVAPETTEYAVELLEAIEPEKRAVASSAVED
jgi:hypothetical protein